MTDTRPPTDAIRSLVRAVIEHAPLEVQAPLLAQAESVEYVDGPVTMMSLRVDHAAAPASGAVSPVPGGPEVADDHGDVIGGLLLWLDAGGYIDCLEYWWVTDDMPAELPQPYQLSAP